MDCRDEAWGDHGDCRSGGGSWMKCEIILTINLLACDADFIGGLIPG